MRLLISNYDYEPFLDRWYAASPGLAEQPYDDQLQARYGTLFGTGDFYSRHLRDMGHQASDVFPNNRILQQQWASENDVAVPDRGWHWHVLMAQLERFRPDVWLAMDAAIAPVDLVRDARRHCGWVVGQHASPVPDRPWPEFDLMLSSLPNLVAHFRGLGMRARHFRLGFDTSVLERLSVTGPRRMGAVFVGQMSDHHQRRANLLRRVLAELPVGLWGFGFDEELGGTTHPPVFGADMFRLLAEARICLNIHIDMAGGHANNMRLYEVTGMGSLLLTDAQDDLGQQFDPGVEVETFGGAAECVEKLRYYLEHEDDRERIAAAGQRRTLGQHTYRHRMAELLEILHEEGIR